MSNNNVHQVESWPWLKMLPNENDHKFTKAEIKSLLLRGPFKDVLLNFLVPRCRPTEEVEFIRSNLYVHELTNTKPFEDSPNSKKNSELTSILAELEKKKLQDLEFLVTNSGGKKHDFDNSGPRNLERDVFSMREELNKVHEIIAFIEGVKDLTPLLETQNTLVLQQEEAKSGPEKLYEVQKDAIQLFRSTFFESSSVNPQALEELNQKLEYLCDNIVRQGRKSGQNHNLNHKLVVWQKSEVEKAKDTIKKIVEKFGSNPNFVEKTLPEIEKDLCKEHIDLHYNNENQQCLLDSKKKERRERFMDLMANGHSGNETLNMSYLLKMVREEQLRDQFQVFNERNFDNASLSKNESLISEGGNESWYKRLENPKELEKVTGCLFKTYPHTKAKLLPVLQTSRSRYSEFVEALHPDRMSNPDSNYPPFMSIDDVTNKKWEDMLHALNPNKESISSNFALQFSDPGNISKW